MAKSVSRVLIAAASLFLAGCGTERNAATENALAGQVTVAGQPASQVTVRVSGPDGTEGSGLTDRDGKYCIENPPKGKLSFVLSTFTPPPPAGVKAAAAAPPGVTKIPAKYTKPGNELSFEYSGGKQGYNIDLKP